MMHIVVAAIAVALALSTPAWAQSSPTETAPCTEGEFVVEGDPLLPRTPIEPPDLVIVRDGTVAIASGCPPVRAHMQPTPHGTILHARWDECSGLARHVRLHARIAPTCRLMFGMIGAAQPPFKRRFLAAPCNDPSPCLHPCASNADCREAQYCAKRPRHCDSRGVCLPRPQACPDVYEPVCGCDGQTYGNKCDTAAAGVNVKHRGPCRPVCGTIAGIPCPEGQFCEFPPAMCDGADLEGMCVEIPDACPRVVDPVCGCDGQTYLNDCERRKAEVQLAHRGRCKPAVSFSR